VCRFVVRCVSAHSDLVLEVVLRLGSAVCLPPPVGCDVRVRFVVAAGGVVGRFVVVRETS
jgi:hypothetical protein